MIKPTRIFSGLVLALALLVSATTSIAAPQTLGGIASVGQLKLTVSDLGVIAVARHTGTDFQDFWFSSSSTGNRLQFSDGSTRAFRNAFFSGTSFTAVSNTLNGNTVTTVYNAVQGGNSITITQETTYTQGNDFYDVKWTFASGYAFTLTDFRWFYGGDTTLGGNDSGTGFFRSATNTVGVERAGLAGEFSIQGVTPQFGYDAITYFTVASNGNSGALSNSVSTSVVDVGMGMEWRFSTLSPGSNRVIDAHIIASVSQPTPTPTSTPTMTPTSAPTATMTPTPVPTAAPSVTPTVVPTIPPVVPTVAVPTTQIVGTLVRPDGAPVPNVVVYLYRVSSNALVSAQALSEAGVANQATDATGSFLFTGLEPGTYRIVPELDDATFSPSTVNTGPGVFVPFTVVTGPTLPAGCSTESKVESIVASDSASLAQLEFLEDLAARFLERAKGKVSGTDFASLRKSLASAKKNARRDYTRILKLTQNLPKLVLICGDECKARSSKRDLAKYRQRVDDLRRLTFFVLRRSNLLLDTENRSFVSMTKSLHRTTKRLAKALPKQSDVCK